jgi:hypothetical protein
MVRRIGLSDQFQGARRILVDAHRQVIPMAFGVAVYAERLYEDSV